MVSVTLWAYACGDGTTEPPAPPPDPPRPTTITVSPATAELTALGATVQLSAEVKDQNGQVMSGATVTWASGATAVATVDASGLVTAVANGTATITATAGEASGTATVTVAQVVNAVAVAPDSATVVEGDTLRLAATATDANGHVVTAVEFVWASGNTAVAVVDSSGLVTAVGSGAVTVTATAGEAAGEARVNVSQLAGSVTVSPSMDSVALGDTLRLVAEAYDETGHVVEGAVFTWLSSDDAVATVDPSGLARGAGEGTATITATTGDVSGTSEITVVSPDRAALVALYNATDGPNWVDNTNWLTDAPLGEWYGVSTWQGRVVQIDLAGRWDSGTHIPDGLRGELPAELGDLARLVNLYLSWNYLSGPIPPELGGLANLKILNLNGNDLGGPIPPELGGLSSLQILQLGANDLWGPIPPELGGLSNLLHLGLTNNTLSGPIPPELSGLSNLSSLDLYANDLSGPIPPELGGLSNLWRLLLGSNDLSGPIPPELSGLSNLSSLGLHTNALSGPIPPELGGLSSLEYLVLARNALSGPIPAELGGLTSLRFLTLYANALSGPIPAELGGLSNLETLTLGDNDLAGPIPPELGDLEKLEELGLGGNELGAFPRTFLNLRNLRSASSRSSPGGVCVPGTSEFVGWTRGLADADELAFCNASDQAVLTSLHELMAGGEWAEAGGWLGGPALEEWHGVETDSLGRVTALLLSDNGLSGSLPGAIADLGRLAILRIDGNELGGRLLLSLTALDLEEFHYDGTDLCEPTDAEFRDWLDGIPSHRGTAVQCPPLTERDVLVALYGSTGGPGWRNSDDWLTEAPLRRWSGVQVDAQGRVVVLRLSFNGLSGPIPQELGLLSNLRQLDLDFNVLSGVIPPELGDLSNLTHLQLRSNELSGPIPSELADLSNLRHLRLNWNGLSGPIPPELGGLSNLSFLTLGGNALSGPIPPELGGLSNLEYLSLDHNALSGPVPPELDGLSNMRQLDLTWNELSGAIPPELGGLSNLEILYLQGNALSGPIPPELGGLSNLARLYLGENELAGPIPTTFGGLGSLAELELSDNRGLAGAMPAGLRNLSLEALLASGTELCVPGEPAFEEWLATIPKWRIASCGEPPVAYLVQAVQSRVHPVPLVAGEDALVRVFITAARATTEEIPLVRARFYVGGRETHVLDIPGKSDQIPTELYEGDLSRSANAEIPGWVIQPGLEMVIDVDPDGMLDPVLGVVKRIPEKGRLAVEVETMPTFDLTLIPFVWTETHDSTTVDIVAAMADDPEDHESFEFMHMIPVGEMRVTAHEPVLSTSNSAFDLLPQTEAIRVLEGGRGHYMGTLSGGVTGAGGIAYLGGRSSFAEPYPFTVAHELGHNLNLRHAPCSAPGTDPSYPYADGSTGTWGYDFRDGRLVSPQSWDLMSYCGPNWISDYHFTNALRYRLFNEGAAAAVTASTRSLLLWGGVGVDSVPHLEPAFLIDAPAALPDSAGDYRITGRTVGGGEVFSLSFTMPVTADGDGSSSFAFALPVRNGWEDSLATITLSGPGGSATLDGESDIPMAILRDPQTGQVRGILRDPPLAVEVAADAAGALAPGLEVLFSRGIPGEAGWRR